MLDELTLLKTASPLGKKSAYEMHYDPSLLFFMSRAPKRQELGIFNNLPFKGMDIWNAYEVSWLNDKGKPIVAIATLEVPAASENIFESKALKLYLYSLNATRFSSIEEVAHVIATDLSTGIKAPVKINLCLLHETQPKLNSTFPALNIDHLDIVTDTYQPNPDFLITHSEEIEEELTSDLLRSNCLITNQPDWGSLYLHYQGKKINHEGLLKYIISLRHHNEFHEQCVERIFMNILQRCNPKKLTVYARYTRRGGIDINPFRTTEENFNPSNDRLIRQ